MLAASINPRGQTRTGINLVIPDDVVTERSRSQRMTKFNGATALCILICVKAEPSGDRLFFENPHQTIMPQQGQVNEIDLCGLAL